MFLLAALLAVQDDTYSNKDYQVSFKLPTADYELKGYAKPQKGEWWSWPDSLAEIRSKDSAEAYVSGILLYFATAWTPDRYAKWREDSWKQSSKNVKRVGDLRKVEMKSGSWVVMELTLEYEDNPYHYLHLIGQKGKHNLELLLWSPEGTWPDAKPLMEKILASFQYGETAGGARGTKVAQAAFEAVVPEGWTLREKDFQLGFDHTVLEMQHGDKLFALVLVLDSQTEPKAWAENTLKITEANFENWKVLDAKTALGGERRDARGDKDGTAYRMAYLFLLAKEAKKNVCFWVFTAEGDWKGYEAAVEALFSSVAVKGGGGGGGTDPGAVKVAKHQWEKCGAGTRLSYKSVSEFSGMKSETTMTYELVQKDDQSWTVKTTMEMAGGVKQESTQAFVLDPKAGDGGGKEGPKPKILGEGEEEVEAAGKKWKCKWVQMETESAGQKVVTKSWTCEGLPYMMLVKSVTKMSAGTSEMILTEAAIK